MPSHKVLVLCLQSSCSLSKSANLVTFFLRHRRHEETTTGKRQQLQGFVMMMSMDYAEKSVGRGGGKGRTLRVRH